MALAPVVAAALNVGLTPRTKILTVGGVDVLKQPTASPAYGVPIESIRVSEAGPGGVSSMSFTILDPTGVITVATSQYVSFWDMTGNLPIFTGWVDTFSASVLGLGRSIYVECIGVEAVLDWMIVPSFSITTGTSVDAAGVIQSMVAQAVGVGYPLNTAAQASSTDIFQPISCLTFFISPATNPITLTGVTLRQAIQAVTDALVSVPNVTPVTWAATVGFWGDLRVYFNMVIASGIPVGAGDCAQIILSSAGAQKPADTQYVTTAAEAMTVYVAGGNAAGSGPFSFGAGPGPVAYISNSGSLTADYAAGIAQAYRMSHGTASVGSVAAEETYKLNNNAAMYRSISTLSLLDSQVGISSATTFAISRIDKEFYANTNERWTISFGFMERSGSSELRRLTRTTLS